MTAERLDDVMRSVIAHDHDRVVAEYRGIARALVDCGPVLDIGCGAGTLLESLSKLNVDARGVDASLAAIRRCQDRGLAAVHADVFDYLATVPDNSIGGAFAGHLVEHLAATDAQRLFEQVFRILRLGGRFLVLTPNPHNLYVAGEGFWLDPTHVRPYPRQLLVALALRAGFGKTAVQGWRQGMPWRQRVAGVLRWLSTLGLHDISPSLLATAWKEFPPPSASPVPLPRRQRRDPN